MAIQVQVMNFQTLVTHISQSRPLVHMLGNPAFQHEQIPLKKKKTKNKKNKTKKKQNRLYLKKKIERQ